MPSILTAADVRRLRVALAQGQAYTFAGFGKSVIGIPPGGLAGQFLGKVTNADFDVNWFNASGISNLDGGFANAIYGGTNPVDGGGA